MVLLSPKGPATRVRRIVGIPKPPAAFAAILPGAVEEHRPFGPYRALGGQAVGSFTVLSLLATLRFWLHYRLSPEMSRPMTCQELAGRIQELQNGATPRDVARLCLL